MGRANRDKPYDLTQAWMGNVETSAADAYNEYGPADALTLWVRMKPDTPVDLGPNKLSPTYTSANTRSNKRLIGNVRYDAATFSDSTGYNAEVYGASGELDMTLAPDTASYNGSDLPFSISMWVNFQDLASIQYLFTKNSPDVPAGAHLPAYYAYTTSLQDGSPVRIGFYLGDDDQTACLPWKSGKASLYALLDWASLPPTQPIRPTKRTCGTIWLLLTMVVTMPPPGSMASME